MNMETSRAAASNSSFKPEGVPQPVIKLQALTLLFGHEFFVKGNVPKGIPEYAEKFEFKIVKTHNGWYLCSASEERLIEAIRFNSAMIINDFLVLKFVGKMTALCIKDTKVGDQMFRKGYWYSPVDLDTRNSLTEDFDNGKRKVKYQKGQWQEMRAVNGENFENITWSEFELRRKSKIKNNEKKILRVAEKYARKSKGVLPEKIDAMTRSQFRAYRKENH